LAYKESDEERVVMDSWLGIYFKMIKGDNYNPTYPLAMQLLS